LFKIYASSPHLNIQSFQIQAVPNSAEEQGQKPSPYSV
jgi:hypothetical protein